MHRNHGEQAVEQQKSIAESSTPCATGPRYNPTATRSGFLLLLLTDVALGSLGQLVRGRMLAKVSSQSPPMRHRDVGSEAPRSGYNTTVASRVTCNEWDGILTEVSSRPARLMYAGDLFMLERR